MPKAFLSIAQLFPGVVGFLWNNYWRFHNLPYMQQFAKFRTAETIRYWLAETPSDTDIEAAVQKSLIA